jgi:hypothetical protein
MTIQPEKIASAADIEAARSELARLQNAAVNLERQDADAVARLELIGKELPIARADGDEQRVNALRAERAALESELRDIAPAREIAQARVRAAIKVLARLEMPGLYADLDAEVKAFVSAVNDVNKRATGLQQKRRDALRKFSEADFIEGKSHELHPARAWRFGWAAGHVMQFLGDFTNQEITRD